MIYKLNYSQLDELLKRIAALQKLYLPVDAENGIVSFMQWHEGVVLSNSLNTTRSAKDFFFPQTQSLMDFKTDGKNIEIIDTREEAEDFVIFGVRACDVASFDVLDRVFLSEPVDTYYKTRREHGTIVSLACSRPDENCFCHAFNIDAAKPSGDVRISIIEDVVYIESINEKGDRLINAVTDMLTEAEACKAVLDENAKQLHAIMSKLPLSKLKIKDFTTKPLNMFNSEKWEMLSASCLGCGTCTFVCPTCQCYDICDFDTGNGIKRFRCWDSCMYSEFTRMAGGNPRITQLEKFRQRFMHKLCYFPANNDGVCSCVGCGRCLRKCPVSMNIVKVIKELGKEMCDE